MLAKTRCDVDLAALRHPRTTFVKTWPADSAAAIAAAALRRPYYSLRSGHVTLLKKREDVLHHLNEAAISALIRVDNRYVGNLVPIPGVFPDHKAPIVRTGADGRELATARWGMPSSQHAQMEATRKRAAKLHAKGKSVDFKEPFRMEPDGGTTNMALQDVANGNGFALIDPLGDLAERVASRITASRRDDLLYLNGFFRTFGAGCRIHEQCE